MTLVIGSAGNESHFFGGSDLLGRAGENNDMFGLAGNDFLIGADRDDFVDGGDGDDFVQGGLGNDTLEGGNGNDDLSGGNGINDLSGGAGNDTYEAVQAGDTITEAVDGGIDTISSADRSFTLAANSNIENLFMIATDANGTGNELNNVITGQVGNNVLDGRDGNDTLDGRDGNDRLLGRAGDDRLFGGTGNDVLVGGTGNDVLIGGAGNDALNGGAGSDRFRLNAANEGADTFIDFNPVNDSIEVSARGFGSGLKEGTTITADQFRVGAAAGDANDRFIYSNGTLLFDKDGTGSTAPVLVGLFASVPQISAANILVI